MSEIIAVVSARSSLYGANSPGVREQNPPFSSDLRLGKDRGFFAGSFARTRLDVSISAAKSALLGCKS
jgi:hypothetical protein